MSSDCDSPAAAARLRVLLAEIRACRACAAPENGRPLAHKPLPHEPRPVLRAAAGARLAVCGQAPGTRVHLSGVPFSDPSGVRLRAWMGVTEAEFYDESRVAILPMGFCFPGQDGKGADLPPRSECAPLWREKLFTLLPDLELILLVGRYAQEWHLGPPAGDGANRTVAETVAGWRAVLERPGRPRYFPLPHPSWRNNAWLGANPWFEAELVPRLRIEVRRVLGHSSNL